MIATTELSRGDSFEGCGDTLLAPLARQLK
jgi:hypothetical protein